MNKRYFQRVQEQTPTKFWINNVTREEAGWAIREGARGCTQNPSYTWKMLTHETEKDYTIGILDSILKKEKDDTQALVQLQRTLVSEIAKIFYPVFQESRERLGYVSIQGDPFHEDTETILKHARYNREAGQNIMAKIPVTKEGMEAIEVLIEERVPINATEVMSVRQALDVCECYEKVTRGMKDPAPIFFSHITGIYDEYIANTVAEQGIDISPDVVWQAGISIAKKIYWLVKEKNYNVGFIGGGARGLHHFTEMLGADACITINWQGTADKLLELDLPVVQRFLMPTPYSVEDELLSKVKDYRRAYMIDAIKPEEYEDFGPVVLFRVSFEKAWRSALDFIARRRLEI